MCLEIIEIIILYSRCFFFTTRGSYVDRKIKKKSNKWKLFITYVIAPHKYLLLIKTGIFYDSNKQER